MKSIAVIGSGAFGAWTAWQLALDGHRVTLIDAYGPANGRASSADHSRVIRAGYGADEIYSRWAIASLARWRWLSAEAGQSLVVGAGALFMAPPGSEYVRATARTLAHLGVDAELLQPHQIAARFPQINPAGLGDTLFEPGAGVIRARAAVQALVTLMRERAMVTYRAARVRALDEQRARPDMRTADGEPLGADAYICACGPWLPAFFPQAVGQRVRATRQEVLYFGAPQGDDRFGIDQLPVWIDFDAGVYGIPDMDSHGFKIGIDRHGPPIDPDTDDRLVSASIVDQTRSWIATRFPDLRDAPLVDARVCQYENTWNGDFLIDRHPTWPNVWIVGGGSGHGFKHGPAVGKHVAALVNGDAEVMARFSLASKTADTRRGIF